MGWCPYVLIASRWFKPSRFARIEWDDIVSLNNKKTSFLLDQNKGSFFRGTDLILICKGHYRAKHFSTRDGYFDM